MEKTGDGMKRAKKKPYTDVYYEDPRQLLDDQCLTHCL